MIPRQHPSSLQPNPAAQTPHPTSAYTGNSLPNQHQLPRQNTLPPGAQHNPMMPQNINQIPQHHMPNNRPPSSGLSPLCP